MCGAGPGRVLPGWERKCHQASIQKTLTVPIPMELCLPTRTEKDSLPHNEEDPAQRPARRHRNQNPDGAQRAKGQTGHAGVEEAHRSLPQHMRTEGSFQSGRSAYSMG